MCSSCVPLTVQLVTPKIKQFLWSLQIYLAFGQQQNLNFNYFKETCQTAKVNDLWQVKSLFYKEHKSYWLRIQWYKCFSDFKLFQWWTGINLMESENFKIFNSSSQLPYFNEYCAHPSLKKFNKYQNQGWLFSQWSTEY